MGFGQSTLENLAVNPSFWTNKKVLVTGHTGFKGAWLSEWLIALGAEVAGYALAPPTEPALFNQLYLAKRLNHFEGDILDLPKLSAFIKEVDPEIVFHMAAQPLVRQSYIDPLETYSTNVMGTAHVLEVCRSLPGLRAVVVITTDKCYENREWRWGYRENESLGGYDPYSSSKACAELVTSAYRASFFNFQSETGNSSVSENRRNRVGLASVRAGNVIGGGDWATDRLIPDAMRAFLKDQPVAIRYPEAIRPWQHVLEPLRGYLMLAQRLAVEEGSTYAGAWNFGPQEQDARSVRWVMDRLCELWPKDSSWSHDTKPQPHEATYLKLDCTKAHGVLDWWPVLSLEKTLGLTVDWFVAHTQGKDMASATQQQIQNYVKHVANIPKKEHEYAR